MREAKTNRPQLLEGGNVGRLVIVELAVLLLELVVEHVDALSSLLDVALRMSRRQLVSSRLAAPRERERAHLNRRLLVVDRRELSINLGLLLFKAGDILLDDAVLVLKVPTSGDTRDTAAVSGTRARQAEGEGGRT
jgi:hypothetical protein